MVVRNAGKCVNVGLAVALEIGKLRLDQAASARERIAALEFNQALWRGIRRLVANGCDRSDCGSLLRAAEAVDAAWSDSAAIGSLNVEYARILAGRSGTQGALKQLLAEWIEHRRSAPKAEFANWLLSSLGAEAMPLQAAA